MARVERIWRKTAHGGAMEELETASLLAGEGLAESADRGGERQLTVLAQEAWEAACSGLGDSLDPVLRRANVLVSGIDLQDSVGRTLKIGACRIRIRGETWPCHQMEQARPGLLEALRPQWRGGAYGEVVQGGAISAGDSVMWSEDEL